MQMNKPLRACSVFQLIFLARGHAIFQGGRTKYSTLIYKSTLAVCHFRQCSVGSGSECYQVFDAKRDFKITLSQLILFTDKHKQKNFRVSDQKSSFTSAYNKH